MTSAFDPGAALVLADQRQLAGDVGGAIELYDRLLARVPGFWPAHTNRGLALAVIGDMQGARAGLRRSIVIEPTAAPSLRSLADSLLNDEPAAGLGAARALVAVASEAPESWLSLGCIELALSRPAPAGRSLRRAIVLAPALAEALLAMGTTRPEVKLAWFRRAVACSPAPGTMIALAQQTTASGASWESRRLLRRALASEPGHDAAMAELTAVIDAFSATDELHRWARRATLLAPGSFAAWSNLGTAQLGLGHLADSERSFATAIRLAPDLAKAHFNRATPLFLLGRMEEAWLEYEWRWRIDGFEKPPSAAPRWSGEPLSGRSLLVHEEQGLGDSLQFARYLTLLANEHAHVSVLCDPRLERLFRNSFPGITISPKPSLPDHDLAVAFLSLPRLLGRVRSIPPPPYLARPEAVRIDAAGRLKVGLVWAGNPGHPRDRERSIPLDRLKSWLNLPGIAWFSFQVGPRRSDIADLGLDAALPDLGGHLSDLEDGARVLAGLDLLVTVDTAACHLAGALGLPVWVLLSRIPDWRWGMTGTTTPWYPSMRLFRQPESGAWRPVIDEVGAALAEAVRERVGLRQAP